MRRREVLALLAAGGASTAVSAQVNQHHPRVAVLMDLVESGRMVTEKIAAAQEAAATLMTGGSPEKVVRRYRTHVRKNRTRLSRHKKG